MEESKNLFSLFEHNSITDRALESRVIVADVLAKFERYVWLSVDHFLTVHKLLHSYVTGFKCAQACGFFKPRYIFINGYNTIFIL